VIIVKNIGRVTSNFFSRFVVQPVASEEKRGSVIPVSKGCLFSEGCNIAKP